MMQQLYKSNFSLKLRATAKKKVYTNSERNRDRQTQRQRLNDALSEHTLLIIVGTCSLPVEKVRPRERQRQKQRERQRQGQNDVHVDHITLLMVVGTCRIRRQRERGGKETAKQ